ncbi:hypothetical protein FS837_009155 [Tulasnella sp. UAMH 9824]|nr:hypothetical protein FS837_009155 [Tulasnella sp. UAMH 9824]
MAATATDEFPDDKRSLQGSGNFLFGDLAADLAHSIFQHVLELDRIHLHDTPLDLLSHMRKTIFRMRCVSALWNRFILSSPQYWCIINVRAPQAAMVRTIELAQAAPLCIYSVNPGHWEAVQFDQILPLLVNRHSQIRTLRLDDQDLDNFGMPLLRLGLPNLRSLELVPRLWLHPDASTLAYDMPRIRHLKSTAWAPKQDIAWIQGLETLVLRKLDRLGPDLYRVLGLCAHGLRHLSLGLRSSREELPPTPAAISIPLLKELRLDMADWRTVMEVTKRILAPPSAGGVIRVTLEPRDLAAIHGLFDFLFPDARDILNPRPATIEFDSEEDLLLVDYPRGNRAVQMRVQGTVHEVDHEAIRGLIHYLDLRLGHPVISVTISCNAPYDAKMMKLLSSSNVQSISIFTYYPEDLAQFLKETITGQSAESSEQVDTDDGYRVFQSLRYLAIDCAYRELEDLEEVIRIVETRQEQLRAKGNCLLDEMTLAHSHFDERVFADAIEKLGAIGIVLREEDWSRTGVDFYLDADIL